MLFEIDRFSNVIKQSFIKFYLTIIFLYEILTRIYVINFSTICTTSLRHSVRLAPRIRRYSSTRDFLSNRSPMAFKDKALEKAFEDRKSRERYVEVNNVEHRPDKYVWRWESSIHKQITLAVRLFGFATQWRIIKYNGRTSSALGLVRAHNSYICRYGFDNANPLHVRFYKIVATHARSDFPSSPTFNKPVVAIYPRRLIPFLLPKIERFLRNFGWSRTDIRGSSLN